MVAVRPAIAEGADIRRISEARTLRDGPWLLELAAVSDRGTVRAENQDGWRVIPLDDGHGCCLMVADGMGGHVGGREAATAALDAAANTLRAAPSAHAALGEAFQAADSAVAARRTPGAVGRDVSGTTLVAAVINDGMVRVGNIGDSRAYLIADSRIRQLTDDHSVAAEHERAIGGRRQGPAAGRNTLTRAVTGAGSVADLFDLALPSPAVLLLCSDGLWGGVTDAALYDLVSAGGDLVQIASDACDAAIAGGSTDNVTLVLCRVKRHEAAP